MYVIIYNFRHNYLINKMFCSLKGGFQILKNWTMQDLGMLQHMT
jgi:hypothetical protein